MKNEELIDLRVLKTQHKIKKAFNNLLVHIGYDMISITILCNHAKISRGTFYNQYPSLLGLYKETLKEYVVLFEPILNKKLIFEHTDNLSKQEYDELLKDLTVPIGKFKENESIMKALLEAKNHSLFINTIIEILHEMFPHDVDNLKVEHEKLLIPFDLALHYSINSIVIILYWWITKHNYLVKEEISEIIVNIIQKLPTNLKLETSAIR